MTEASKSSQPLGFGSTDQLGVVSERERAAYRDWCAGTLPPLPERLEVMADTYAPGSQEQADLYAAATHVRKTPPYAAENKAAHDIAQYGRRIRQLENELQRECDDGTELLRMLGLDPDVYCTDGGSLNLPKIRAALADSKPANVGGEARLAAHQPSQTTTATPQGVASTDQLGGRVRSEKD